MIDKIKNRMASEEGFTLIELLVVIIILGILVAIAVPAYLSFAGNAKIAAAKANVRSAIPAAESYYENSGATYTGLTGGALRTQAPGVAQTVMAGADSTGTMYCVQDTEPNNVVYSYLGGQQASTTANAATIAAGACPASYNVS